MSYRCEECGAHWWGRPERKYKYRERTYEIRRCPVCGRTTESIFCEKHRRATILVGVSIGREIEKEILVCPRCCGFSKLESRVMDLEEVKHAVG